MHGISTSKRSHRVVRGISSEEKRPNRTPSPRAQRRIQTQALVVALALAPAAAFVGPAPAAPSTVMKESLSDLKALQQSLPGPPNDYFDPLNLATMTFDWGPQGEEATIGWLRHSEIKHGRVAMAAFLGYLAGSTELVSGPHKILPYRGYEPGLTPPEQWDAIPLYGKLQIIVLVGMLESYGEILDPHYTNGGLPGYYPPIKGKRPELVFNLFDPFGFFEQDSDEKKARGRLAEINNGRLAMLGIFSILSEAGAPGSVPALQGLIPAYDGNVMIPFSGDFSIFS